MKKICKKLVLLLTVILVFGSLFGCGGNDGNNKEIENLVSDFRQSCNKLDIDAMLDCIDPTISDKIRLATGIVGMFADMEASELMDELASLLTGNDSLNADEFFSSIMVETGNIDVSVNNASIDAVVEYTLGGEKFQNDASFSCVKEDGKWYISNFALK